MTRDSLNHRFLNIPPSSIVFSIALHGAAIFLLGSHVLEHLSIFKSHPLNTKPLYQNFVQVDVVALPDQMIHEKIDATLPVVEKPSTAPLAVPPTLPIPSTEEEDVLKLHDKKEEKKREALKKKEREALLRREADARKRMEEEAFKKIQEQASREEALKSLVMKRGKSGRGRLAGNRLSQGTSATGIVGTVSDKYAATVQSAIEQKLVLYAWHKKRQIGATVHLEITPAGRVREKRMLSPSPDQSFNSNVMQVIDAAQPLPVPEDLSILSGGITVEFRSKE